VTNYTSINTCAAIGSNFAATLPKVLGVISIPKLSTADVQRHLGGDASWEQRRAFEWGMLAEVFRRNGDETTMEYCHSRIRQIAVEAGY
jgi:hypothetical protein